MFEELQDFSQMNNIGGGFLQNSGYADSGNSGLFLIFAILIIAGIINAIRKKDKQVIALALKKFELNENNTNPLVSIEGRAAGIISWLLTIMKISPIVSFETNNEQVIIKSQSLYGENNCFIPLKSVSVLTGAHSRNITYLILTILFVICGIIFGFTTGSGMLIKYFSLAVIFGVSYWLSKKLEISILTKSGLKQGISFKRSIIGNIPVDIEKVKKTIDVINKAVLNSVKK